MSRYSPPLAYWAWRQRTLGFPGAGGGLSSGGAAPAFDPASLFAASEQGVWYDPSDLTSMFTDLDGLVPVTADGDLVARINDKSGNGKHWIQDTGLRRPIYRTSGGLSWLEFDGADDFMYAAAPGLGSGLSAYLAVRPNAGEETWMAGYDHNNQATCWFGVIQPSSATANSGAVGSPTYRVNGVGIGNTRQDLLTAIPAASQKVLACEGLDLSTFANLSFMGYGGFEYAGRLYGYVVAPNQSSGNRASLETWLGAKAGVTL